MYILTKLAIVFVIGALENFLYTWYLLEVGRKRPIKSSILDFVYMLIYLELVAWAIKDSDTLGILVVYAVSCGIGNYLQIKWELYKQSEHPLLKKEPASVLQDERGSNDYGVLELRVDEKLIGCDMDCTHCTTPIC